MIIETKLDAIVAKWHLLQHPFYRAWTDGTLPVDALRVYAQDYGQFVTALPRGWQAIGDTEYTAEEVAHIALWEDFAASLKTSIAVSQIPQMEQLMSLCDTLFADRASALGAMYAFERQQPETAVSKLEGLREHFSQLDAALSEPYFEVHSGMQHEAVEILRLMQDLTDEEQLRAVAACEAMGEALWHSLTGILEASGLDMDCAKA